MREHREAVRIWASQKKEQKKGSYGPYSGAHALFFLCSPITRAQFFVLLRVCGRREEKRTLAGQSLSLGTRHWLAPGQGVVSVTKWSVAFSFFFSFSHWPVKTQLLSPGQWKRKKSAVRKRKCREYDLSISYAPTTKRLKTKELIVGACMDRSLNGQPANVQESIGRSMTIQVLTYSRTPFIS